MRTKRTNPAPVKITARGKKDNAFAPLLPPPYNWKNYGEMNMELWRKHQDTSLEDAKAMLQKSHEETMRLAESFSNEELFSRDAFPWTGEMRLALILRQTCQVIMTGR